MGGDGTYRSSGDPNDSEDGSSDDDAGNSGRPKVRDNRSHVNPHGSSHDSNQLRTEMPFRPSEVINNPTPAVTLAEDDASLADLTETMRNWHPVTPPQPPTPHANQNTLVGSAVQQSTPPTANCAQHAQSRCGVTRKYTGTRVLDENYDDSDDDSNDKDGGDEDEDGGVEDEEDDSEEDGSDGDDGNRGAEVLGAVVQDTMNQANQHTSLNRSPDESDSRRGATQSPVSEDDDSEDDDSDFEPDDSGYDASESGSDAGSTESDYNLSDTEAQDIIQGFESAPVHTEVQESQSTPVHNEVQDSQSPEYSGGADDEFEGDDERDESDDAAGTAARGEDDAPSRNDAPDSNNGAEESESDVESSDDSGSELAYSSGSEFAYNSESEPGINSSDEEASRPYKF